MRWPSSPSSWRRISTCRFTRWSASNGAMSAGGGSNARTSACSGSGPGRSVRTAQVAPVPAPAQGRDQAGEDDRRLAAARAPDERDQPGPADLAGELLDLLLPPEEQPRVLLAERQEAAVRADRLPDAPRPVHRLAADAGEQELELRRVVGVAAQVDPGLEAQEPPPRVVDLGQ